MLVFLTPIIKIIVQIMLTNFVTADKLYAFMDIGKCIIVLLI